MLKTFGSADFVTQAHELIVEEAEAHILTELCRGGSLHERVVSEGAFAPSLVVKHLQTLAEFTVACHGKGMPLLLSSSHSVQPYLDSHTGLAQTSL